MEITINPRWPALQGALGLLALLLMFAAPSRAGEDPLVSGQYFGVDDQDLRIELKVGAPSPATVIVTLKLPAGVLIEQARPAVNRFDQQSGEAKWLLNGLVRGRFPIKLRFSRPVPASDLQGQIRYKHPTTGVMAGEKITPAE